MCPDPSLPHKEVLEEAPADLHKLSHVKRPRNEGTGTRNEKRWSAWLAKQSTNLSAPDFRDCTLVAVHHVCSGKGNLLPGSMSTESPCNCLWLSLKGQTQISNQLPKSSSISSIQNMHN